MTGLNPAHIAGLRRLSARASAAPPSSATPRNGLLSLPSLAEKLITHLKNSNIRVEPGLSHPEFARAEAEFSFTFPPDLKAVLSLGLPIGPGFPNWRLIGPGRGQLRAQIELPIASVSFHIARNTLWSKSWGPRPTNPEKAIKVARNCLKRAPLLIPVFNHCYIPCNPNLAGNPVFYIDESQIFCCGYDLSDFFDREHLNGPGSGCSGHSSRRSLDSVVPITPRWIDFWSGAAIDRQRRNSNSSSSSTSSPDWYFELTRTGAPKWVGEYVAQIGSVLREGGWSESDVDEIVHVSASGFFEDEMVLVDNQAILDALLLKTDRFADLLRKSGWSSEEVSEAFGFDLRPEKGRRLVKKLSPELVERFGKLAESVSRS